MYTPSRQSHHTASPQPCQLENGGYKVKEGCKEKEMASSNHSHPTAPGAAISPINWLSCRPATTSAGVDGEIARRHEPSPGCLAVADGSISFQKSHQKLVTEVGFQRTPLSGTEACLTHPGRGSVPCCR